MKVVDGITYRHEGFADTIRFNCNSWCVYKMDGDPNTNYCFADGGDKEAECQGIFHAVMLNIKQHIQDFMIYMNTFER